MSQRLLKGISLLLGAMTSCDSGTQADSGCPEYACESACYLHGTVTDASTGQPIPNIELSRPEWGYDTRSEASGAFTLWVDCCESTVPVMARDIDGDEHGGHYAPQHTEATTRLREHKRCKDIYEERKAVNFALKPLNLAPMDEQR